MIPMAIIISKLGCPTQGSASLELTLAPFTGAYWVCGRFGDGWLGLF